MRKLLHFIPLIVVYLEYQAMVLALGFVRFEGDYETYTAFHGFMEVGRNYSFYDVPGLVRSLHIVSLGLALGYFIAVIFFGYKKGIDQLPAEPTTF
ncbi:MAG: hypothetical protein ACOY4Q_11870 [Bacillota bacterium]